MKFEIYLVGTPQESAVTVEAANVFEAVNSWLELPAFWNFLDEIMPLMIREEGEQLFRLRKFKTEYKLHIEEITE